MRNIKGAVLRCILILLFVTGLEAASRLCYEEWSEQTVQSKLERKQLEGTLDTIYCGSSLVYRAFNPEVIDDLLGTNSFNLGTASQNFRGSYYLMRETAEHNPITTVVQGISLVSLKKERNAAQYLSAFENMEDWRWKLRYLVDVNWEEVWIPALFYSTQIEGLTDVSSVRENLEKKLAQEVSEEYLGRGWRAGDGIFAETEYNGNNEDARWIAEEGESQVLEEALDYLNKMAAYCREEGIRLVVVNLPWTECYTRGAQDLDDMHQFFEQWAAEQGVEYLDFALYKERQKEFGNEMFLDEKHLNRQGGLRFSALFAEVLESDRPEEYFYTSMEQFEGNGVEESETEGSGEE